MKTPSKKNLQTPTVPTTHVVPRPSLRPIPLPPPDGRKTVVIVEDQTAIRELTTEMLETRGTYRILGTAADGNQGLDMVLKLRPDILILDVMMPGLSGIEVLRRIGRNLPKMRILVFSAKQEPQVVRGLIQEGVHGFVNKNSPLSDLRKALDEIAKGNTWFNDHFSKTVRDALAKPSTQADSMIDLLTPREREISVLIAQSNSSKEVAAKLNISIKTSENHRANLMRKLGVHDVAGLVRFAIRHGLVDPATD
ncbi:transcriptional regulatory protein MctR [Verrucomicrobiota bacterium]|jgi:DNA-binding NarL/FixJ family response regulator|nr:transcriptional regulatory protein MctR [Verrucomicrobiota bacterium]